MTEYLIFAADYAMIHFMQNKIPKHIGIIMDGNRRWATEKGLPPFEGHRYGVSTVRKIIRHCFDRGVKYLTLFTFSTDNWSRPKKEVDFLLRLIKLLIRKEVEKLHIKKIRVNILGRVEEFPKLLRQEMYRAMEKTKSNTKGVLNLALNYGGRVEILDAVKKIISSGLKAQELTEETISQNMYAPDISDPDLIIRTSGELRTSGFLLWEAAYAELYFTKKYWPDFEEKDLDGAIEEYSRRQRRFGK